MARRTTESERPVPILSDLAFHILLATGDGPSHGYAIGKDVEARSDGRLDPTTGALYQALRRMAEEGLIASVKGPEGVDPRRKYVALTELGRRAVANEAQRLDALVKAAQHHKLYPQGA